MSKKKWKPTKRPRGWLIGRDQIAKWLDQAQALLMEEDYVGVLRVCKRILRQIPPDVPERADAYNLMGNAYGMLQQFEESYQAYTKALAIVQNEAYAWYNRAIACRYTLRMGQSLLDLERAVELEGAGKMAEKFAEELSVARSLVKSELELRGPDFTLEDLVEQQEWYQKGLQASTERHWEEAIQAFQRSIEMGDCLPSPHGNVGMCLIMLRRYEEAGQALQRALEIDPKYEFARKNLQILEEVKKTGILPVFGGTQSPFEGHKLNQSIMFLPEDD